MEKWILITSGEYNRGPWAKGPTRELAQAALLEKTGGTMPERWQVHEVGPSTTVNSMGGISWGDWVEPKMIDASHPHPSLDPNAKTVWVKVSLKDVRK